MGALRKTAGYVSTAILFCALSAYPVQARLADRIVDAAANATLNAIQTSSCAQFAAQLASRKSSSGGMSGASGMLKNNSAERQRFVDKVAGPLVNKLIDCGMLPHK